MINQKYIRYISISLVIILLLVVSWPKPIEICKDGFNGLKELLFGGIEEKFDKFTTKIYGDTGEVITVKSDSIDVLDIKDAADLHVCSQEMQDYAVEKQNGKCTDFGHHLIHLSEEEHKLILIVRERCYYNVNLNNVKYVVSHSDSTIYVTMPQVEDKYDFIEETDIPDEKDFWANFKRNNLRHSAITKISQRFNTKETRQLAQQRANYLVSNIVSNLVDNDYKVVIVNRIEQKRG